MAASRANHGICRVKDKIYCAGGNSHSVVHKCTEIYDTKTDTWKFGPDLNRRKFGLTLVSAQDRFIYSIG